MAREGADFEPSGFCISFLGLELMAARTHFKRARSADEPTARCSIPLPRTEGRAVMDKKPIPVGEQIITIVLLVIFALVIWYGVMI
ncbi:hypothetical protein DXU07_02295 [Bradyrhizobium elkanii]|nr:hypothetical protein BLN97_01100 [Bradyrhizobium elkanii]